MSDSEPVIVFKGRYLDLIWEKGAEYTRNRRSRGVVLVVPVTKAGEIVFLEQYRIPLNRSVIEFPAGLVGDEAQLTDESFEAAARRELLEESGYDSEELEYVMSGPSSPGSSSELVTFYFAHNSSKVHEGGGRDNERIRVCCISLDDADAWLKAKVKSGVLVDPRVYLGVHWAKERRKAT